MARAPSRQAIDYDVAWPEDYGFSQGECRSRRKKEACKLQASAELGVQTGEEAPERKSRMCFFF